MLCKKAQENRYITFVDADDSLPADALKKMVTAIRDTKADIVCEKNNPKVEKYFYSREVYPALFCGKQDSGI